MSAGTGILHSEKNDSWRLRRQAHTDPVHFVQMWVVPDESGITPGYEQLEIDHELLSRRAGARRLRHARARRRRGDPDQEPLRRPARRPAQPGQSVPLPDAPYLHLFVPRGSVTLEGAGPLATGDAVRFTATGGQQVTATEPAEILVWEMHATLG